MRSLKKGLCFAMEDDTPVVNPVATDVVPESQAEVEADTGEITEKVGEIEQIDTAVADAETDAGTLGEIQETMQETVDQGEGMDETAAEITEIAVEALYAKLGMKPAKTMPAMESFGSVSSRVAATKVAIESLSENIKKIWEAIVKAMKAMWAKVSAFIEKLMISLPRMKKHLTELKARAEKFEGEAPAVKAGAKALSIDGKANFETAKKILESSVKLVEATGSSSQGVLAIAETVSKATDVEVINSATESFSGRLKEKFTDIGNLANGKTVTVSETEGKFGLELTDSGKAAEEAESLKKEQMVSLLDMGLTLVTKMEEYKKIHNEFSKAVKAVESVKFASGAGKDDKGNDVAKAAITNVRALSSVIAKLSSSVPSVAYQAAKGVGDYVSASLKGKKEDPKKDTAPAAA